MPAFIKKLQLLWADEYVAKDLFDSLSQEYRNLVKENELLRATKDFAPEEVVEKVHIPLAGFDDLQHEPTDTKGRQGYIERVDEFYTDVLQKKLYSSIAEVRELYGNMYMDAQGLGITRAEYDWFVRGIEAGLFKVDEWARTLQAERQSILQEQENSKKQ